MINCEKERAPENGVEKLIATTCSAFYEGEELTVRCFDSCPEVYKQGRAVSEEELYKYQLGDCFETSFGRPLAELTSLVLLKLTVVSIIPSLLIAYLGWYKKFSYRIWTHH